MCFDCMKYRLTKYYIYSQIRNMEKAVIEQGVHLVEKVLVFNDALLR